MLAQVRAFFAQKNVLEVDCPALLTRSSIDRHIDVMSVETGQNPNQSPDQSKGYLHTSPEYAMKRLLSEGIGDIYQLGHVFRAAEVGNLHNPEFTMIEWYRVGFSFEKMIQETLECIHLFLPGLAKKQMRYNELFKEHLCIDCEVATPQELFLLAKHHQLEVPDNATCWDKDTLLQLLLSLLIEPHLGKDNLFVLTHFPSSQAALAQTEGSAALRFEVYYQGIELANGYKELRDSKEQKKRLQQANEARIQEGKPSLPLDERFIEALEKGLPECCGVAAGFDRLLQLKHNLKALKAILPFPWDSI